MQKSLDRKLAAIHADPGGCREFIIADAKDADMGFGIGAPGLSPERHDGELRFKTLAEYREQIRQIVRSELVDIMLMSAHTNEILNIQERLFDNSPVTPAARANDATDVHVVRGGRIIQAPTKPFRSASLDHIQCGHLDCDADERYLGADLGLYSVTFNNDMERDLHTLEQFKLFREECERKGFRYFLEVFDPNVQGAVPAEGLAAFVNDCIVRSLAGVTSRGRPVFLKIVYHGPRAMEELVRYDPHLIVGVLGGAAGTTRDAFQLLYEAKKYGAKVALFGRKINQAECQLAFVEFLRLIADGHLEPEEAVRAYHAALQKLGISPQRKLEDDLLLQTNVMSYGGSGKTISLPTSPAANTSASTSANTGPASTPVPAESPSSAALAKDEARNDGKNEGKNNGKNGAPNFAAMSPAERLQYHRDRLNRMLGQ